MSRCPLFEKCGGCKFDFTSADYHSDKLKQISKIPTTNDPVWIAPGNRRRAEFSFLNDRFGFFAYSSRDIINVRNCPVLVLEINMVLPRLAAMPWHGSGSVLVTACDNGIDVSVINPSVARFSADIKRAADSIPEIIRMTWGGVVVKQTADPIVKFGNIAVKYPGGFLQPSVTGEAALRELVVAAANGATTVADLFCGLGTFTYALGADGFDIHIGRIGKRRDLFTKPLTPRELKQYDCVVIDPPRAGASAQVAHLAKSGVKKIIYVSCNPDTFMRDARVLEHGGYKIVELTPVDQFTGSIHWELVGIFILINN